MKIKTDHGTFDVPEITFKARRELHQLEVKAITKEGDIDTAKFFDVLDWITNYSFTDGKDIVLFNDVAELTEKAEYYISHPNEAEIIANAGYEHMLKYHTTKERANQFLSLIKEYL